MLPDVASSSPAISRSAVVFPHPDGPTSTVNCLSGMSSVTLFTATTLPNCLVTCSSITLAIVSSPDGGPVSGAPGSGPGPRGARYEFPPSLPKHTTYDAGGRRSPRGRRSRLPPHPALEDRDRLGGGGVDAAQARQVDAHQVAHEHERQDPGEAALPPATHLLDASGGPERQLAGEPDPTERLGVLPAAQQHDHRHEPGDLRRGAPADGFVVGELRERSPGGQHLAVLVELALPPPRRGLEILGAGVDRGDPAEELLGEALGRVVRGWDVRPGLGGDLLEHRRRLLDIGAA